jgi:cyclopropane fatty-acyl-phospholipid synthase-like methyltransferase
VEHDTQRRLLRATFEQLPALYDRARPSYPLRLFDDLATLARLPDGARLVEIGCGTGQATLPLAGLASGSPVWSWASNSPRSHAELMRFPEVG